MPSVFQHLGGNEAVNIKKVEIFKSREKREEKRKKSILESSKSQVLILSCDDKIKPEPVVRGKM